MEIVIITVAAFALIGFIVGEIIDHCCKHEWEIIKTVRVHTDGECDYDRIYLQCKKCGKVKLTNMK